MTHIFHIMAMAEFVFCLAGEEMASEYTMGKKAIQPRQCIALGNVLHRNFGSWHSGGCHFDMSTYLNINGYTPRCLASMEHRYFLFL